MLLQSNLLLLLIIIIVLVLSNLQSTNAAAAPTGGSKSLYETLGVSKGCTPAELKKAYRRQCLRHHPDKGGNEETFKEVTRAYDTLSDESKRTLYDQYGESAVNGDIPVPPQASQQPGYHTGGRSFFAFRRRQGSNKQYGGVPSDFDFSSFNLGGLNAEDLFGSARSRNPDTGGFNLDISELLRQMGGRRSRQGDASDFFGRQQQQSGWQQQAEAPSQKSISRTCWCTLEELASGATKKLKVQFPAIKNTRANKVNKSQQQSSRIYTIQLQKGWKAGTKVTFKASKDGRFPPITFVIQEKKHPIFQRQGDDLVYRHDLSTMSMRTSTGSTTTSSMKNTDTNTNNDTVVVKLELVLPDGEIWMRSFYKKSSFLRKGQKLTVPEKGMPIKGGPARGDLIIEFYDSSSLSSSAEHHHHYHSATTTTNASASANS